MILYTDSQLHYIKPKASFCEDCKTDCEAEGGEFVSCNCLSGSCRCRCTTDVTCDCNKGKDARRESVNRHVAVLDRNEKHVMEITVQEFCPSFPRNGKLTCMKRFTVYAIMTNEMTFICIMRRIWRWGFSILQGLWKWLWGWRRRICELWLWWWCMSLSMHRPNRLRLWCCEQNIGRIFRLFHNTAASLQLELWRLEFECDLKIKRILIPDTNTM